MQLVFGNLLAMALEGKFDLIGHGCNCFNQMERGIAADVKELFPAAYAIDQRTVEGAKEKLGTIGVTYCRITRGRLLAVANCYTQYHWDEPKGEVLVDYGAVRSCMRLIKERYSGMRIGLPQIGAGLARGDWKKIEEIILRELANEDVTIVVYDGKSLG